MHYKLNELIGGPILAAGPAPGWGEPNYSERAALLARNGIEHSFCLLEDYDYGLCVGEMRNALGTFGIEMHHYPMVDNRAPKTAQLDRMLDHLERHLAAGKGCYVHCVAGLGRTGTALACLLVRRGFSADQAIREIRRRKIESIVNREQEHFVKAYGPPGNGSFRPASR